MVCVFFDGTSILKWHRLIIYDCYNEQRLYFLIDWYAIVVLADHLLISILENARLLISL